MRLQKAFTLIELLAVIAIVSLISTIILASLNSARQKAKEVTIRQNVDQLVIVLAQEYSERGNYAALQKHDWNSPTTHPCYGTTGLGAATGPYANKARDICQSIINQDGLLRIGNRYGRDDVYSISVFLGTYPHYLCRGSNGRITEGEEEIVYVDATYPGCHGDPDL